MPRHSPSTPCPCPGTEQGLSWFLFLGKGWGRGQAVTAMALSILPGGFTPKALGVLCRERKYQKISPFCAIPTVSGSAGACRAVSQPVSLVSCRPQRQGWHWAGRAMGLCSASSHTAKPAPHHAPRGEHRRSPRGLKEKGWGCAGCWHLQPWFTTPSCPVQAGQAAWCPKATPQEPSGTSPLRTLYLASSTGSA